MIKDFVGRQYIYAGLRSTSRPMPTIRYEKVPRGELWLGTALHKKAECKDNLSGYIKLIEQLNQDYDLPSESLFPGVSTT